MASSWKSLPIHLSDPARLLTERLREVKDVQSLSLSEIARRTHYPRLLSGLMSVVGSAG